LADRDFIHSDCLTKTGKAPAGGPVRPALVTNLEGAGAEQLEDAGYNFYTL